MNKEIYKAIDPDIQELSLMMNLYRAEAERKRRMLGINADDTMIQRVGHADDLKADAMMMLIEIIIKRKLENSTVRSQAANLKLISISEAGEVEEIHIPVNPSKPIVPKIESPALAKEAEEVIATNDIEESIVEAVQAGHWDIARSKVTHFFRDEESILDASQKELDDFIKDICKTQADKRAKKFEDEIGVERNVSPITSPTEINKVQYMKNGKFNIGILIGNTKNVKAEDRVKLSAIQAYTAGNQKLAVQLIHTIYKDRGFTEATANEFLLTMMKKDPLKELNISIKGILEFNHKNKGDAKQGIKLCRSIVGAYLEKKFVVQVGEEKLTPEQDKENKVIDRIINRQLKELTSK